MWNGEIISYVISDRPDLKMVTDMLQKAFRKHQTLDQLIMHYGELFRSDEDGVTLSE